VNTETDDYLKGGSAYTRVQSDQIDNQVNELGGKDMTKVRGLVVLAVVALLLFPAMAFAQGGLQLPCRFYGDVTIYGDPAPDTLRGSMAVVPKTVMVTVASNPSGLQIDVDGISYSTPRSFSWDETDTHQLTALSPQSGGTGIRYSFNSWSDNGSQQHIIVVPAKDTTFTADYFTEYELTTSVIPPGAGTINVFPAQNWFMSDSSAILHASPDTNYIFSDWSGDLSGAINPDTLIMDSPKDVTANFTLATNVSYDFQNKTPEIFALKQNFPNPFNPITYIEFDLPRGCMVNLQIFNLLGKEMDILVSEQLPAGRYTFEWNAAPYASGVYIYRLQAQESLTSPSNGNLKNGYVMTKKMIYMR